MNRAGKPSGGSATPKSGRKTPGASQASQDYGYDANQGQQEDQDQYGQEGQDDQEQPEDEEGDQQPEEEGDDQDEQPEDEEEGEDGQQDDEEQYGQQNGAGDEEDQWNAKKGKQGSNALTKKATGAMMNGSLNGMSKHQPKPQHAHSRFAMDPHHHKTMQSFHNIIQEGLTPAHVESFVHIGTYALAHLAHQHGMTAGHEEEENDTAPPSGGKPAGATATKAPGAAGKNATKPKAAGAGSKTARTIKR